MGTLNDKIQKNAVTHLFATPPPEYAGAMKTSLYSFNIIRLALMSIVLVGLDCVSLVAYLFYYLSADTVLYAHIVVHICVILLFLILFFFFYRRMGNGRMPATAFGWNTALVYTVVHFVCEFLLFATGPHDIAAFIRLCAVPFMMGAVPILKQSQFFVVNTAVYIVYNIYIFAWPLGAVQTPAGSVVANLWVDVYLCTLLVSFLIYSAYVNNFVAGIQLKASNERLETLSRQDALTGLNNRRHLVQHLDATWESATQRGAVVTAMMFDIDYFKQYNDHYGHVAGDECLVQVSGAIQAAMQAYESVFARYGGEEFIVILYDHDHERIVELAEGIRQQIESLCIEHPHSNVSPYVTVSVGVSSGQAAGMPHSQKIIERADEALYKAKRDGRNRVVHTGGEPDVFHDAGGRPLLSGQPAAEAPSEDLLGPHLKQMLRDSGSNCYFVYYVDPNGAHVLDFSEMAHERYLLPRNLYNATWAKIVFYVVPDHREAFLLKIEEQLEARATDFSVTTYLRTRDNDKKFVSVDIKVAYAGDKHLRFAVGYITSVEEVVQYSRFLQQEAMLNSITLLPNRKKFAGDMHAVLGRHVQGHVLLIDVKRFKLINSVYSHNIGDKVLHEVAATLRRLAAGLEVYSYAIDQFILILEGADQQRTLALIEKVNQYFGVHPLQLEGIELNVGFTFAAVAFGRNKREFSFDALMVNIDIALQKAKRRKSDNYFFFADIDRENHLRDINLERRLLFSVKNDYAGFFLHYQPILEAEDKRVIGVEALLRWSSPDGEVVPPLVTIPVLEKNGLMSKVENWIFELCCHQCRRWMDLGAGEQFFVQINLSPAQIYRDSLAAELEAAVRKSGIGYANVVLEVTESSLMMDKAKAVQMLRYLQGQGVRIAVDDFGTGYSSLSYLRELPVDEIKIDKSFVGDIVENESARGFLNSIVELAKNLGCLVCVEGIETAEQLQALEGLAVDCYQGFLFLPPVEAEIITRRLRKQVEKML